MLHTLYELVQLCLRACNYCPHLNGISRLARSHPSGAQHGSFQPCIFQPCHFRKKINVLLPYSSGKCHAILSCVGGIAATVVAEEGLQLWNSRRSDIAEKKRWMCKQYREGSTVNAAQSDTAPRSNIKATVNSK